MKVQIEVDIPEGYEFVRYDVPKHGEIVISNQYKQAIRFCGIGIEKMVILKQKEPKVVKVNDDKFTLTLDRCEIQNIDNFLRKENIYINISKEINETLARR